MEPSNPISTETSIEDNHEVVSVTDTVEGLQTAIAQLKAGHGPIAADAERASGFRYTQRPYLIQLFRRGSGVILLDPPALGDLSSLTEEFADVRWILHAASQDLPNLREHGIDPQHIFDTELAAKLLGLERFGLAALLEQFLDIHLAKKFSAVDWSTRPLPQEWLVYAALDVEYLIDLAELLMEKLDQAGRTRIADAEFESLLKRNLTPAPKKDPWRRLSGIHQIRTRDQLAIAQALWMSRDQLAQESDTSPGRLIPDKAIVAVAIQNPRTFPEFMHNKNFQGRASRSEAKRWWSAIRQAQKLKEKPELKVPSQKIPPVKAWERQFPDAKQRFDLVRPKILALADELQLAHDLLLTPEILRTIAFFPPTDLEEETIAQRLRELGARDWQISYTAPIISQAFVESLQNVFLPPGIEPSNTPKD